MPNNLDRLHVAVIMDGNGRWAETRGLPRTAGHTEGVRAVRSTIEAASELGVGALTLYAFSSDNWQRPPGEVGALMRLLETQLHEETAHLRKNGVRLSFIGRRDRLPPALRLVMAEAETATAACTALYVRIAVDYSARDAILRAAASPAAFASRDAFARALGSACGANHPVPDVDLLIRTGGEQRLSDFLLWECAYAELYFTDTPWPGFTAADLRAAVEVYHHRSRRFGRVPAASGDGLPDPIPPVLKAADHLR